MSIKQSTNKIKVVVLLFIFTVIFPLPSCSSNTNKENEKKNTEKQAAPQSTSVIVPIRSEEHFQSIVDSSGDRLLVFDLYADWCMPCRILSPVLEELARENKHKASFYKVDVEKHRRITAIFRIPGIPFVVFVKNQKVVHALTGANPKAAYQRAINEFAGSDTAKELSDIPDGEIINGIRTIFLTTATTVGNLYVYRGDKVKLIIQKIDFPYSIHIPQFNISQEGVVGKDLEVTFKANDIGVFPIFCNGQCPAGDGARFGQIIVMQYKSAGTAQFVELKSDEAKAFIEKEKPLVLDVRTPNEYHRGHLKGAKLIPVQQLENRLNEIAPYKNKKILVYCRSGNRSTVASQIMIKNGFKKIYNMRHGIKDWQKKGYPTVK